MKLCELLESPINFPIIHARNLIQEVKRTNSLSSYWRRAAKLIASDNRLLQNANLNFGSNGVRFCEKRQVQEKKNRKRYVIVNNATKD